MCDPPFFSHCQVQRFKKQISNLNGNSEAIIWSGCICRNGETMVDKITVFKHYLMTFEFFNHCVKQIELWLLVFSCWCALFSIGRILTCSRWKENGHNVFCGHAIILARSRKNSSTLNEKRATEKKEIRTRSQWTKNVGTTRKKRE